MKTILITGIAGFIGSSIAKSIDKTKYKIIGVDSFNDYYDPSIKRARAKKLEEVGVLIYEFDLFDSKKLNNIFITHQIDGVMHMAASGGVRFSVENPGFVIRNNIVVTNSLLEIMNQHNVKSLVFASSSSIYGNIMKNRVEPVTEDMSFESPTISPYAMTKLSCELSIDTYSFLYGMHAISLRFFTVYGPNQRPDLAIMKFITKIRQEEEIEIYGDGNSYRDYTYIDDVVHASILSLEKILADKNHYHHKLNISSNKTQRISDMVSTIENILEIKSIIKNIGIQQGDVVGTFGDNTRVKEILNWEPKMNFIDGIKNMIDWFIKN